MNPMRPPERFSLFLSPEHRCGYLPDRSARNAYIDPAISMSATRYSWLLEQGFRRSGGHVYRPYCQHCQLCIPARIPVSSFNPNRSQRRCAKRNEDLTLRIQSKLQDRHFALYRDYLRHRHEDGGMEPDNREAFDMFLHCAWLEVQIWEFWLGDELLAFSVIDRLPASLSAVYTCYRSDHAARGLGSFAVLQALDYARSADLPHVYLGYWVPGSRKMDYKRQYQPLEVFSGGLWQVFDPAHTRI